MKKNIILLSLLMVTMTAMSQKLSKYDANAPFGWANATSLEDGDNYKVTGANEIDTALTAKKITLVSNGQDMIKEIKNAIRKNDIIVFDGSNGDFIVSKSISLTAIKNKTIVGINNARISTKLKLTQAIHDTLNAKHVEQYVSSRKGGTGFVLSNGARVKEERESVVRQTLIDVLNDPAENYRESGLFGFNGVENIIIRNLTFVGPGSVDVGGKDIMTLSHSCKHIWIDHCDFIDGMDGNFDINSYSDFITISWCRFKYTDRSFDHANTNLIGSSDREEGNGEDNLNVTYYACNWDAGCDQRMPMVRFGTVHLLNNLYTCVGNSMAVNPRFHSEVLIEGNVFGKGVKKIFKENDAKSVVFKDNCYAEKFSQPDNHGKVLIPYKYNAMPAAEVSNEVSTYCGATLADPLKID